MAKIVETLSVESAVLNMYIIKLHVTWLAKVNLGYLPLSILGGILSYVL